MKRMIVICALLALASPVLAQQSSGGQAAPLHGPMLQDSVHGSSPLNHDVADTLKLRSELADMWQSMGMSPKDAKTVADAYRPPVYASRRARLHGKSDDEVSAMIQSALARKNYQQANQLLIDYQRQRMASQARLAANDK